MCWLPVIIYWLLALYYSPKSKDEFDKPKDEFYKFLKFLDGVIHVIFPSFVLIQSIVAYCCNDKIKSEVLFVCKEFCCICSLCCKQHNKRNISITNRSGINVQTDNSGNLETPFIGIESSFDDDHSISSFTDESSER